MSLRDTAENISQLRDDYTKKSETNKNTHLCIERIGDRQKRVVRSVRVTVRKVTGVWGAEGTLPAGRQANKVP